MHANHTSHAPSQPHAHAPTHAHASGHAQAPSDVLRAEHEVIEQLLDALDGIADAVTAGGAPQADLDAAIEVLTEFADDCHHGKEERVLFPALRRASPTEGTRIALELEGDHMAGRKLLSAMRAAVPGAALGRQFDARNFAHNERLYAKMLRAHIKSETTKLFPLMDRVLTGQVGREVAEAFDRVEREEMGAGTHERYESAVRELHERYA